MGDFNAKVREFVKLTIGIETLRKIDGLNNIIDELTVNPV